MLVTGVVEIPDVAKFLYASAPMTSVVPRLMAVRLEPDRAAVAGVDELFKVTHFQPRGG